MSAAQGYRKRACVAQHSSPFPVPLTAAHRKNGIILRIYRKSDSLRNRSFYDANSAYPFRAYLLFAMNDLIAAMVSSLMTCSIRQASSAAVSSSTPIDARKADRVL